VLICGGCLGVSYEVQGHKVSTCQYTSVACALVELGENILQLCLRMKSDVPAVLPFINAN